MYIFGKQLNENIFESIYSVFKKEADAQNYIKKNAVFVEEGLSLVEKVNLNYPFFLLEEIHPLTPNYILIDKAALESRVRQVVGLNDFETIYFNLWRISGDLFNENFPNEQILRGRDWHLHFMDHDLNEIELSGFEAYWNELLIA